MALAYVHRNADIDSDMRGRTLPPFDGEQDPHVGIAPNMNTNVVLEPASGRRRFKLGDLWGRTTDPPRSSSMPPAGYLRGTAEELRERLGHDVPPPPRTWGTPERTASWAADGFGDASAPLPHLIFSDADEDHNMQDWPSDKLNLLDRVVNKDHANRLHEFVLDVQIIQHHLHTFMGDEQRATNRTAQRYNMSRTSSPAMTPPACDTWR